MDAIMEDAIVKRIVKSYLHQKGEASTRMLADHIISVGYGLQYEVSVRVLSKKLKKWMQKQQSTKWFRIECTEKNNEKWWRLV